MQVKPISCYRPTPEAAAEFASLPYDVYDRAEARAYVAEHPRSFLAIDRPETQFDPDYDMYAPEVYKRGAKLLDKRITDRTLLPDAGPCYFIWSMTHDGHTQTGIVAACSVDEYLDGTIRRHENTRPEKEQDRVRHIEALSAQTGPIFLAYRDQPVLDTLVEAACAGTPIYHFVDEQGVEQKVWRVARPEATAAFEAMFEHIPCAYIADGHHRAASAVRVCKERREQGKPEGGSNEFLAVLFPANQLTILPYNRVVSDRAGLSPEELLSAIRSAGFTTEPSSEPVVPTHHGETGMYVDGSWWRLVINPSLVPEDAVASLDASIIQDRILGPILGITDPTRDQRISYVGGVRGTDELERRAGAEGVAFSMHATSVDELLAVADNGQLMPPKSTWFEPKLLSGLFVRQI